MRVVTAGVNGAFLAVDREGKRVHVGAQHQNRTGFFAADVAHDARAAHVAGDGNAEVFESLGNIGGSLHFLHGEFGNLMEILPKGYRIENLGHDNFSFELRCLGNKGILKDGARNKLRRNTYPAVFFTLRHRFFAAHPVAPR